jgi:uncharacterized HAD superfamily protein
MCDTCGCRQPRNPHQDARHITAPMFYNAAFAAGIPPDLAYENLGRALQQDLLTVAFLREVTRPRIVCDIDGTLAQRDQAALVAINAKFGTQYRYSDMKTTKEDWIDDPEAREWYKEHRHDDIFLVDLPAYQDGIWGLWSLRSGGYHVTIASDREDKLLSLSKTWLKELEIDYDEIHVGDGEKLKIAEASSPEDPVVFIDDNPSRAEDLPGPGRKVLLLDRPWNQEVEEGPQVKRVHNWKDVMRELPAQSADGPGAMMISMPQLKSMLPTIFKVGWDEDLHPRGSDGRFLTSGNDQAREIVDRNLVGKTQGASERSVGVHRQIVSELHAAGLHRHADEYQKIVQEAKDKGTLVHPRNVMGRANARVYAQEHGQSLEHKGWQVDHQLGRAPRSDSKQTGEGRTSGIEKEWADNQAKAYAQYPQLAVYGDRLRISHWDHPDTVRSVAELSMAPQHVHEFAARYFSGPTVGRTSASSTAGIYIDGAKTITGLNKLQYLSGSKTIDGRPWSGVGGVHSSFERVVAVGDLSRSGSINTALHELGHAIDHAAGNVSLQEEFGEARQAYVNAGGRLGSYFEGTRVGPGRQPDVDSGKRETFAEGFAHYMTAQKAGREATYTTLERWGLRATPGSQKALTTYFSTFTSGLHELNAAR